MSKWFTTGPEPRRIDIDENTWIEVLCPITDSILTQAEQLSQKLRKDRNSPYYKFEGLITMSHFAKLIYAWNVTDDNGEVVPITLGNLAKINVKLFGTLLIKAEEQLGDDNPFATLQEEYDLDEEYGAMKASTQQTPKAK